MQPNPLINAQVIGQETCILNFVVIVNLLLPFHTDIRDAHLLRDVLTSIEPQQ